jgi:hypothetical protein
MDDERDGEARVWGAAPLVDESLRCRGCSELWPMWRRPPGNNEELPPGVLPRDRRRSPSQFSPHLKLSIAVVALIFTRSVDQTLYYRLAKEYDNYVWFLATVILPIAFLIVLWPICWYKIYVSKTGIDDISFALSAQHTNSQLQ